MCAHVCVCVCECVCVCGDGGAGVLRYVWNAAKANRKHPTLASNEINASSFSGADQAERLDQQMRLIEDFFFFTVRPPCFLSG